MLASIPRNQSVPNFLINIISIIHWA